jgi:hypothetical protein
MARSRRSITKRSVVDRNDFRNISNCLSISTQDWHTAAPFGKAHRVYGSKGAAPTVNYHSSCSAFGRNN